jgi:hypothetical protein
VHEVNGAGAGCGRESRSGKRKLPMSKDIAESDLSNLVDNRASI